VCEANRQTGSSDYSSVGVVYVYRFVEGRKKHSTVVSVAILLTNRLCVQTVEKTSKTHN